VKKLPWWFRAGIRILGAVCPPAMAAIAWRLFWDLGTPMPLAASASRVHDLADRTTVTVNGRDAIVYRWGTGPNVILLVHGWRGRASQFAALIDRLDDPSRTIVAFDAPGNGDASGSRTDLFDYVALIRGVAADAGTLEAIVGHSFGVLAMFTALREGVRTGVIVSIAGVSGFDYVVDSFAEALDLPVRVTARLRHRIQRELFDSDPGFWQRYRSRVDPADRTPLLVIHDADDRAVDPAESKWVREAHSGHSVALKTSGLGHTRVLSDPAVLDAIVSFVNAGARTR
jgi:alpha-beta hydrolase superfamily lysophospholipase